MKSSPSRGTVAASGRLAVLAAAFLASPRCAHAGWAEDALKCEADYIVNCSFTLQAKNNRQVQAGDAAYGALNNVRLADEPDWVRPGEGAAFQARRVFATAAGRFVVLVILP